MPATQLRIGDVAQAANDEPIDLRPVLREVITAGDIHFGLSESAQPIAAQAAVISGLAEQSLAVAFITWSHRMTTEYVDRWATPTVRDRLLPGLLDGSRIGSTALATALVDAAGFEPISVTYTRTASGDFVVDGRIPWASNLHDGTVVVFGARNPETEERVILVSEIGAAGIQVKPAGELIGLNGTNSGSITFTAHQVPAEQLLSAESTRFFAAMRPRFLLLQSAFCLGLSSAALAHTAEIGTESLAGLLGDLRGEHARLQHRLDELAELLAEYRTAAPQPAALPFVQLRLDGALLAQAATRLELAHVGGRGYFQSHPTSRRVRESLFLSIQAPTEGSLRWEIQRSS